MSHFKKFKNNEIIETRLITVNEIKLGARKLKEAGINISNTDINNGSPKKGDRIARCIEDHSDQWLIAQKYFENKLSELMEPQEVAKYINTVTLSGFRLPNGHILRTSDSSDKEELVDWPKTIIVMDTVLKLVEVNTFGIDFNKYEEAKYA